MGWPGLSLRSPGMPCKTGASLRSAPATQLTLFILFEPILREASIGTMRAATGETLRERLDIKVSKSQNESLAVRLRLRKIDFNLPRLYHARLSSACVQNSCVLRHDPVVRDGRGSPNGFCRRWPQGRANL